MLEQRLLPLLLSPLHTNPPIDLPTQRAWNAPKAESRSVVEATWLHVV